MGGSIGWSYSVLILVSDGVDYAKEGIAKYVNFQIITLKTLDIRKFIRLRW